MIHKIKNLNRYLVTTAPELFATVPLRWFKRGLGAFPAFKERNYRIYFAGQFLSLIGSWLQVVAQGWLVFELTHSAFWVGFVTALSSLPVLFFGLIGGVVVDRFDTKKILYITQVLPMVFAAILGFLTLTGNISLLHISVLAFLLGVVNALDVPARQTFTAKMIERRSLASAIVLNSAAFNGSRIIGPSFAGLSIALIGIGGTFVVNAASFLAVIGSLVLIRADTAPPETHPHPVAALKEGIRYTLSRRGLRLIMVTVALTSIFGWSYAAILPVIAGAVFHRGAEGLGQLYTAVGVGALCSTLLVSLFLHRLGPRPFMLGGSVLVTLALAAFSFVGRFDAGLGLMFLTGLGLMAQMSVMQTTVQHSINDAVRGRVMSIYVTMFRGMAPFGAFLIGYLGDAASPQWAIRLMALPLGITAAVLIWKRDVLPRGLEEETVPEVQ